MPLYPRGSGGRVRGTTGAVRFSPIGQYTITPSAIAAASIVNAKALTASAQTNVTTGITQPDVPRVLSIVGNASGIAGNVVITGLDAAGAVITDTIALNGTTTVSGTKAFASVTSVSYPIKTNSSGDTVSIGVTNKLGFPTPLSVNTVLKTFYNSTLEGTPPTVTAAATTSGSFFVLNTTLAGAKVDIFYLLPA